MPLALAGSPTTADPIDALLGPAPTATSPIADMRDALHGRLGLVLALGAVALVAWLVHRSIRRRQLAEWRQRVMIHDIASRGFALYRSGPATPGMRVDALTPSWPTQQTFVDPDVPALPAPDAHDLQTPPWATWVKRA